MFRLTYPSLRSVVSSFCIIYFDILSLRNRIYCVLDEFKCLMHFDHHFNHRFGIDCAANSVNRFAQLFIRVPCAVCLCSVKSDEKYSCVLPRLASLLNIVSESVYHVQSQESIVVSISHCSVHRNIFGEGWHCLAGRNNAFCLRST